MQPTLTRKNQQPHEKGKRLYVTIHVDDLLVIGDEHAAFTFLQKLEAEEGWKLETKGPFGLHGRFDYWKTKTEIKEDRLAVRPDDAHITDLEKLAKPGPRDRKTPCAGNSNPLSKEDEAMDENDWREFRSCVGKLLHVASEPPDCQYLVQGLTSFMQKLTKEA